MKLAIVTDAWHPQVNGVVTTLSRTRDALERLGHDGDVIARRISGPSPARPTPRSGSPCCPAASSRRRSTRSRRTPSTSRPRARSAWRRARYCVRERTRVHDLVPHAIPAVRAQARADSGELVLCVPAPPSRPRAAHARGDGAPAARSRRARFRERRDLVARRRRGALPAVRPRRSRRAAPDLDVRGPRRGREEPRGLSRARPCRARRSSSATARIAPSSRGAIPTRAVRGLPLRRGARGASVGRRRVRVPEPHRHVRARDARSHGLRHAGRGLPGHRPHRRRDTASTAC